jgi:hypothetical protein
MYLLEKDSNIVRNVCYKKPKAFEDNLIRHSTHYAENVKYIEILNSINVTYLESEKYYNHKIQASMTK